MPRPEPDTEVDLVAKIRVAMAGTLIQDILNYIKLKISKKDAMRVSSAVVPCVKAPRPR